jgi:hypothetical protein
MRRASFAGTKFGGRTPEAEHLRSLQGKEARAGWGFLSRRVAKRLLWGVSPNSFFFPPRPSGKIFCSAARSAAIKIQSPDFRQKKSGFCPKGTANYQIIEVQPR